MRRLRHGRFWSFTYSIPECLPPCETWFALLNGGSEAFLSIFTLEAELLQLAFNRKSLGERDLGARLYGTFNASNRPGGLIGRTELASIVHDIFPEVLRLVDVVDET